MRLTPAPALAAALVFGSVFFAVAPAAAANPCVTAASNAQDLRAAGKLREARAALAVCARESCNSVVRSDCEKWLREIDEQQPTVVVRAVDPRGHEVPGVHGALDDAPIELDGVPVQVDPGPHVVRLRSRSGDVAELRATVALGEKARVLEVRFESAPPDRSPEPPPESAPAPTTTPTTPATATTPVVPLALAGVGSAAFVVFGIFELLGQAGYADLKTGCAVKHACTADDLDPVKTQLAVGAVALAVAIVAFGAAALVYVTSRDAPPKPRTTLRLDARGLVF